jgi:hypothetical protein
MLRALFQELLLCVSLIQEFSFILAVFSLFAHRQLVKLYLKIFSRFLSGAQDHFCVANLERDHERVWVTQKILDTLLSLGLLQHVLILQEGQSVITQDNIYDVGVNEFEHSVDGLVPEIQLQIIQFNHHIFLDLLLTSVL